MTDPELPDEIRLRPGESHVLRFPSRGLSGYRWETAVEGSAVEVIHEVTTADGAPGAAGDEVIRVRAVAPGEATVTVARRRRWGPASDPDDDRRISVVVSDPS